MFSAQLSIEYHSKKDKDFKEELKKAGLSRSVSFFFEKIQKPIATKSRLMVKDAFLGEGSSGKTYAFTQHQADERRAVKEMICDSKDSKNIIAKIYKESYFFEKLYGYSAVSVGYPSIIRLYMIKLPGIKLAKKCTWGASTIKELLSIYSIILSALIHLHENNVVHGDLSANNILLTRTKAYFCDFGMAREIGEKTSGIYDKSYYFHAPELCKAIPAAPDQDVYSLGIDFKILLEGSTHVPDINQHRLSLLDLIATMTRITPAERAKPQDIMSSINSLFVKIQKPKPIFSVKAPTFDDELPPPRQDFRMVC